MTDNDAPLRDMASSTLSSKTLADLEKPGERNLIRTELITGFNNILGERRGAGDLPHRIRDPMNLFHEPQIRKPSSPRRDVSVLTSQGVRESRKAGDIRSYDFRQSGFLAPSELRRIRQRHEQFVRSLAARLAIFLRLEFTSSSPRCRSSATTNSPKVCPTRRTSRCSRPTRSRASACSSFRRGSV